MHDSEESWRFADREASARNVNGAEIQDARNAPNPLPGDLHQETDLNKKVNVTMVRVLLVMTWMETWS